MISAIPVGKRKSSLWLYVKGDSVRVEFDNGGGKILQMETEGKNLS